MCYNGYDKRFIEKGGNMDGKKRYKTKIIIAASVTVAVILLAVILVPIIILAVDDMRNNGPHMTIHFADPSLSEDIYADAEYMSYDRAIYYITNEGYTVKTEIPEADYPRYSKEVQLLIALVKAAIAGDADAYNACFCPEYIAASGREEPFTMQKIYDIEIINYHQGAPVPEGYREASVYGLRYKIKDNNGSLRYDMGSDAVHEQYISTVTDDEGKALIYGVQLHYTRK